MPYDVGKMLIANEAVVRLFVFIAVLIIMAALEAALPRRRRVLPRITRWVTNLSFVGLGALVVRGLAMIGAYVGVPLIAFTAARIAEANGWGLFNVVVVPGAVAVVASVIALDFAIWFQHYAAHQFQWLWIIHRVHHADPEIDVTTALRFHPIEIGLSMIWKILWVLALGAPPAAVIAFEVILNGFAMFNHANVRLPVWLDRVLRIVIVTPDMHRVHHSILDREHRSNFGFNLSIWDRMFATYVAQPTHGHDEMTIGLPDHQTEQPTRLWWSLKFPFGQ